MLKGCFGKKKEYEYRTLSSSINDECNICLDTYRKGQTIIILNCGHKYHKDCIHKWFQKKRVCPLCSIKIK